MPFTPLHIGPAMALKAVAGRHFSLISFGLAQVAMDIEPLIGLWRGDWELHGTSHTYWAALVIAAAVTLLARAIQPPVLRHWNRELAWHGGRRFQEPESAALLPLLAGALTGTLSHVVLDSVMHADTRPLAPWSDANGLYGILSTTILDLSCLILGLAGVLAWLVRGWLRHQPRP